MARQRPVSETAVTEKMKNLLVLIPLLFGVNVFAQDSEDRPVQDPAAERENPVTRVPYESGRDQQSVCEDRWSNFLPFLGRAACERGYVLPRPFGVSLGYMHQDQPFDVTDIFVNGIDVKTPGVAVVDEVQNEETTFTLRLDTWILPFWNIYGILGRTDGKAEGPLDIAITPIFPGLCALPGNNCTVNTTFALDYSADVLGVGTTVAGGYKDFFGMIDVNYTEADLDISLTDAEALVISSRIGWNGKLGWFTGVLWVGAMYQDIDQELDLPLDIGQSTLLVSIDQSTQEPLNYLVGGQWDVNRSFSILAEMGFGERRSQMLNFTFRF